MKVIFERERTAKNSVRYAEVAAAGDEKVGTIYIKKTAVTALGDPTDRERANSRRERSASGSEDY